MAEPFLSEIRLFSFQFAPKGWALCNGQFLPINQNQALFALLGTTFGGNGQTTFQLPDLRGRVPIHVGSGHILGERAGESAHTLTQSEMPQHVHMQNVTNNNGTVPSPAGNVLAAANNMYHSPASVTTMRPQTISNVGGSQPHQNTQPYTTLSFCIALQGIFPSPN